MKKFITFTLVVSLCLGLVSCTAGSSTEGGLTTRIENLEEKVDSLAVKEQVDLTGFIKRTELASYVTKGLLQDSIDGLQIPNLSNYATIADLDTSLGGLVALDYLESILSEYAKLDNIGSVDLSSLEASIQDLKDRLALLTSKVTVDVVADITSLRNSINAIEQPNLSDYYDKAYMDNIHNIISDRLIVFDNMIDYLSSKVDSFNELIGYQVKLTRPFQNVFTVKAVNSGNYVVELTLYGSNLDLVGTFISTTHKVNVVYDECFGVNNSMRVFVIEPKPSGDATSRNWTTGETFNLELTSNGSNVKCGKATTCVR